MLRNILITLTCPLAIIAYGIDFLYICRPKLQRNCLPSNPSAKCNQVKCKHKISKHGITGVQGVLMDYLQGGCRPNTFVVHPTTPRNPLMWWHPPLDTRPTCAWHVIIQSSMPIDMQVCFATAASLAHSENPVRWLLLATKELNNYSRIPTVSNTKRTWPCRRRLSLSWKRYRGNKTIWMKEVCSTHIENI